VGRTNPRVSHLKVRKANGEQIRRQSPEEVTPGKGGKFVHLELAIKLLTERGGGKLACRVFTVGHERSWRKKRISQTTEGRREKLQNIGSSGKFNEDGVNRGKWTARRKGMIKREEARKEGGPQCR